MATILVVDDELGIRGLLSEILTDEGHTVELAENAAQARAVRERMRPDLVLLDIWMPDVDGITLLKEWGASAQLHHAGDHDERPRHHRHRGRGHQVRRHAPSWKSRSRCRSCCARWSRRWPSPASASPPPWPACAATWRTAPTTAAAPTAWWRCSPTPGPQPEQSFDLDRPLREARDAFEKSYFEFHLARENGSMTRVAEKTGLERTHLYRKLKQLGVDLTRNKRGGGL